MRDRVFTNAEIEVLCRLYEDCALTREEESALEKMLEQESDLPETARETLRLMKAQRALAVKANPRKNRWSKVMGVAASLVVGVMAALTFSLIGTGNDNPVTDSDSDAIFVVWQNGRCITGEEARRIALEQECNDLEMMRIVLKSQRELLKVTYASVDPEYVD